MLSPSSSPVRPAVASLLILVAAALAWGPWLSAPFEMDDHSSIVDNATIRHFWSWDWLRPPATAGETVAGRPVLNFTFALNHALGGLDVRGYRAVNVLIHALAALALFGIVRRTLVLPGGKGLAGGSRRVRGEQRRETGGWRDETGPGSPAPGPWAVEAGPFALAVALIWLLHPLQTESVTYVVQRAESLAGLFYLLTLYGFIRGAEPSPMAQGAGATEQASANRLPPAPGSVTRSSARWFTFSVLCCFLGMATKEVMVSAPVVILLYDRAFVAGSFAAAWRRRRAFYLPLASAWLVLALLVAATGARGGSAGFGGPIGWWGYALTQCQAILHYLRLALWPRPLVFDYGVPTAGSLTEVWWQAAILLVLLAATIWALAGNPAAGARARSVSGFLGAGFFLLLAPSSSVLPVTTQTIAEHRMYLPLAIVVVLAGAAVRRLVGRLALPGWCTGLVAAGAVLGLGTATIARNQVYRSELALWQDTAARRPDNPRAHHNLGLALANAGRLDEAAAEFRRTIALQPNHAFAHFQLGTIHLTRRQWDAAAGELQRALAADPHYVAARVNLGQALTRLGRPDEAAAHYRAALADDPGAQDARVDLAALLIAQGREAEGEALLRQAIAAAPAMAEAHFRLGLALEKTAGIAAAEAEFREAVRLKPGLAAAHLALGNVRAGRGDAAGAEASYREALRLDAGSAETHYAWGNLLAGRQRFKEAITAFREALRLDPAHAQARNNLANCLLVAGRRDEAIAQYREALKRDPGNAAIRENLDRALHPDPAGGDR